MEYVPQTKLVEVMRGKLERCALTCLLIGHRAEAQNCLRPIAPYVPERADDIRVYSDILRLGMEACFAKMQRYFRCIDSERAEVFEEARSASEAYGRVLETRDDR